MGSHRARRGQRPSLRASRLLETQCLGSHSSTSDGVCDCGLQYSPTPSSAVTYNRLKVFSGRTHVPLISVERIAVNCAVVHPTEDDLITHYPPCGSTFVRLGQLAVEPILLGTAHERAACVVLDFLDVVIIPVERRDRSVVITRVEHNQVEELAHFEASPDAQIVIHVHLANSILHVSEGMMESLMNARHPFEIGSNGVHFAGINADASKLLE